MSQNHSYGVLYSPFTVTEPQITVQTLQDNGIRYIRVQWADLLNNIRYRIIPTSYFLKLLDSQRPSICTTRAVFGLAFNTVADGFSATGEYLYVPDLSSIRRCPYAPGHASVMGWFEEKVPVRGPDGNPTLKVDLCPRTLLHRVVEAAKSNSGVSFLVGFETEFILLKTTSPIQPVNTHIWGGSPALPSGSVESKVLEEIADGVQASGIELQMYLVEGAPGQYEVVTGPLPPLEAADALIHTREIIHNTASRYGLRATLAPRVFDDSCGTGAHAHISIHSCNSSPPSTTTPNLTALESSFLSALLTHLPALTFLNLPTPASYKRVVDDMWSGGTYVCWGTDNREAPVRLCNASSPASRNFELKALDGTANPHLALAGVLGVGHAGIREGRVLEVGDCSGGRSAAEMGEDEREALGIRERMPLSLEEAGRRFVRDDVVRGVLGEGFVEKYVSVNKKFAEYLTSDNLSEEEALKLLIENY